MVSSNDLPTTTYVERLETFEGYWSGFAATARQLAAIGHVSDRPPLETLLEGSRCIDCSHFVPKFLSTVVLEGSADPDRFDALAIPAFHRTACIRLQIRLPFETPEWFVDRSLPSIASRIDRFDSSRAKRIAQATPSERTGNCSTGIFSLPIEIRLQIYKQLLPPLDSATEIVQTSRDSMRVGAANPHPHGQSQSSILRVCRTMHHEVLDLIFSSTTFTFASTKVLYMFLRRIGKPGRLLLRNIDLCCGQRDDAVAFALLASCEGLRSLTLRLPRPRLLPPGAPLWLHDGVSCLLDLSGIEDVRFASDNSPTCLDESMSDAELIRRELSRPRGSPGTIRSVNGILDI